MLRLINLSCVLFLTLEDVVGPVLDIHPLTHSQQAALGSFSIELGIQLIGKKLFKTAERSGYWLHLQNSFGQSLLLSYKVKPSFFDNKILNKVFVIRWPTATAECFAQVLSCKIWLEIILIVLLSGGNIQTWRGQSYRNWQFQNVSSNELGNARAVADGSVWAQQECSKCHPPSSKGGVGVVSHHIILHHILFQGWGVVSHHIIPVRKTPRYL